MLIQRISRTMLVQPLHVTQVAKSLISHQVSLMLMMPHMSS